jgi:hypothetical protein
MVRAPEKSGKSTELPPHVPTTNLAMNSIHFITIAKALKVWQGTKACVYMQKSLLMYVE